MALRNAIRLLVCGLVLVIVAVGAGTVQAARYAGVRVKGYNVTTSTGGMDVPVRLVCPPATQSTPRPGDFSFCTGELVISVRGKVLARGPFSIRTFDSHLEHFPSTPAGRATFKKGKYVTVRWVARSHDGRGRHASNAGSLRVFRYR